MVEEIRLPGDSRLAQLLSGIYIGDVASVALAKLRGVDPDAIRTIQELKQEFEKLK